VKCSGAEAIELAKLTAAEQQTALKEVTAGEYGSFREWLNGKPVAGAKVEVWHANSKGGYSVFDSSQTVDRSLYERTQVGDDIPLRFVFHHPDLHEIETGDSRFIALVFGQSGLIAGATLAGVKYSRIIP
jgi:hypothetical protein